MISESLFKVYNASAGSGKTFTLVKEYLKIVLQSKGDLEFQKILAITFTNKAAAEMKERVLSTLKDASTGKDNEIVNLLKKEISISDVEIREKATTVLKNILHNYASFNIVTIDSFTHKLIRTFSLDLGLPLDFDVEMDTEPLLEETIDLLISKIGEDKDLTETLIKYTLHQVNDDKSWDINKSLIDIAKLLLNEENELEVSKLVHTQLSDFKKLEEKLQQYLVDTEKAFQQVGEQALSLIDENNIAHSSFASGDLPRYFMKFLGSWTSKEEELATKRLTSNMESGVLYSKTKPKDPEKLADREKIDAIEEQLFSFYAISQKLCQDHLGQYFLVKKILKSIVPLAVLSYISKEFTNLKEENNIRLNSEFNRIIGRQIKNEPVPFIYERLGEKYQYFFIDEMQDTSELQWQNLIPLIHNTLSQKKGGLMLVGDAKQSIYRWRGGKASQFVALSQDANPFFIDKKVETLDTNYRSYSNIIDFKNEFFSFLSGYLKEPAYQEIYEQEKNQKTNSKKGGYVKLQVFERDEEFDAHEFYAEKVYEQIIEIEKNGFDKGDVCILTRKKGDGISVAKYLTEKGIEVISPDSLLLKNNPLVEFFIRFMRWIENNDDKQELIEVLSFLKDHLDVLISEHEFYETCIKANNTRTLLSYLNVDFKISKFFSQSLYDGVEYIIRAFKLQSEIDVFGQAFLDLVLQFQLKESGSLQSFLEYWNKKREKLTVEVAANKNAVQVMTIHKSKGLEFPVVIFPFDLDTEYLLNEKVWYSTQEKPLFNHFESFQIPVSSKLALYGGQGELLLRNTSQEVQLDNFNLLYVALTRAEEQLYILSDTKKNTKSIKNYSDYFKLFIAEKGKELVYEIGSPQKTIVNIQKEENQNWLLEPFLSVDKKVNQIHIVQQQEMDDDSRFFGNLIHQAFEKIISIKDIPKAFSYLEQQGLSVEVEKKAKQIIHDVVNHPDLIVFYQEGLEVHNERSFLAQSGEINIMDRVVFKDNKAIIIDYKTGRPSPKDQLQLKNYEDILSKAGFLLGSSLVIYCNKGIEVCVIE